MRVRVVDTPEGLRALEPAWDELTSTDPGSDPFGRFDWVLNWWQCFGDVGPEVPFALAEHSAPLALARRRSRLHVLVAEDGSRPAAILPLVRSTGRWHRLPVRVLAPPLNAHAPRSNVVASGSPEDGERAMSALIDHLVADRSWDVLLLHGVPSRSPRVSVLAREAERRGLRRVQGPAWSHSYQALEGTWSEYRQLRGRHFRKHIDQFERALAKLGPLSARRESTVQGVARAMKTFVEIDADSWKSQSGECIGSEEALTRYYEGVAQRFALKDACEVWTLEVGGEPAAAFLCLRHGTTLYTLKTSFRRKFGSATQSPGTVLFTQIIQDAWARGLGAVDFVGRMPFSERWTQTVQDFAPLAFFRLRPVPLASRWIERVAQWRSASSGPAVAPLASPASAP